MKQIILLLLLSLLSLSCAFKSFSQDTGNSTRLLHKYYAIKNALVAGDAGSAANAAGEFQASLNEAKSNPAGSQAAKASFQSLNDAATVIKTGKDIGKQREAFAKLSQAMISLVKSSKPSEKVYVDYCPMKKASWLSAEQAIKNPYYGAAMLTCGKITDTIH